MIAYKYMYLVRGKQGIILLLWQLDSIFLPGPIFLQVTESSYTDRSSVKINRERFNAVSENCSRLLKQFLTVVQHNKVNDSSVLSPWPVGEMVSSQDTDLSPGRPQCIQIVFCLTKTRSYTHTNTQHSSNSSIAGNWLKAVTRCQEFVWKINCGQVRLSLTHGCLCSVKSVKVPFYLGNTMKHEQKKKKITASLRELIKSQTDYSLGSG